MKKLIITSMLIAMFSGSVLAHSGGTDSRGCHTNSKTGEYHCHSSK